MTIKETRADRAASSGQAPTGGFAALTAGLGLNPAQDFRGANLRGVNFRRDDLTEFDFTDADLSGANLSATSGLNCARIAGVRYDHTTLWPSGIEAALRAGDTARIRALLLTERDIPEDLALRTRVLDLSGEGLVSLAPLATCVNLETL